MGLLQFLGMPFYFVNAPLPDSINKDENRNTLQTFQNPYGIGRSTMKLRLLIIICLLIITHRRKMSNVWKMTKNN